MTDITELAQMKGQKVEGSYYLAECTDCGKMYPSNKLNGGEPLFCGDYGECYCPHCNADDAAIGDCGDTAATAWNYQQNRIDALVEALEKAQQYAKERDAENQDLMLTVGRLRVEREELESRTVKLPKKNIGWDRDEDDCWNNAIDACTEALTAAGIKVEQLS
ncbi:TPA: ead/Ea22-like family protein [Klebsiella oxytoca]|nr:ead/Ea22-like family protein [Klebsiella oxytoca]